MNGDRNTQRAHRGRPGADAAQEDYWAADQADLEPYQPGAVERTGSEDAGPGGIFASVHDLMTGLLGPATPGSRAQVGYRQETSERNGPGWHEKTCYEEVAYGPEGGPEAG
jgi:hypothetical protein